MKPISLSFSESTILQTMSPTAVKQVSCVRDAYEATKDAHGLCILIELVEFNGSRDPATWLILILFELDSSSTGGAAPPRGSSSSSRVRLVSPSPTSSVSDSGCPPPLALPACCRTTAALITF
jgi:hypothetical protein